VDAITYCASQVFLPLRVEKGSFSRRPWLSLVLGDAAVNN
jgi:hypothetical protein